MPVHQRTAWRKPRQHRRPVVQLHVETLEQRNLLTSASWPGLTNPILEVEPNNTVAVAQSLGDLTVNGSAQVSGAISPAPVADVDWYTFTLDQAAEVTVLAHALTPGGPAPVVSLYNTDSFNDPYDLVGHRMLAQSSGPGDASIDRIVGAGTYYVAISGAGNRYFNPNLADSGQIGGSGDYGLIINATNIAPDPSGLPTVLSADMTAWPTPNATTATSPLEIHLNLSGPIDPLLQANLSDLNVQLTAVNDPTNTNLASPVTFSFDANELLVTPVAPLAPGNYTISVAATSISGIPALAQDFSQAFTVSGINGQNQADDTAATAQNLGDVTTAGLVQRAGAIGDNPAYDPTSSDPTLNNPAAGVDMYHFQVSGSGKYVMIGEVFAGRIGSPLDPVLTLFRRDPTSGHLVVVDVNDNTTNPTQDTNNNIPLFYDAAMFDGLTAGDYYLAVSSSGNAPNLMQGIAPGTKGVFDPNVPHSGTQGSTTGPYVLNLLVHPAGPAPEVVAATPADQSTLTAPPAQLTVQFNVPVNVEQLSYQAYLQSGGKVGQMPAVFIKAADGSLVYPRLQSYDTTTNTATFMLLGALPNGASELHLSGAAGLADLAGTPLAGNDPSGDYVVHFTVNSPARGILDPGPGTTKGMYVWQDQEPNDSAKSPQILGTLFPLELQKGVVLARNFTSNPASAPSDTADYYEFTVLQGRTYSFALAGINLPPKTVPVITDLSTGKQVWLLKFGGGLSSADLHPGKYLICIGGWTTSQAAKVSYTLKLTLSGSAENPTPLTSGPAPAFRIRLPDPPPPPPPPPVQTVTPPSPPSQSTPTPPAGSSDSGTQLSSGQTSSGSAPASDGTPQTQANSGTTQAQASAPATTQTANPPTMGPIAPTGPLRLVLPTSSGESSPPGRVVQVSATATDAGAAPAIMLRAHVTEEGTSSPNVPVGALIQLNVGAVGGVRATEQISLLATPLRLTLPRQETTAEDFPAFVFMAPPIGGDDAPAVAIVGGPDGAVGLPGSSISFPQSWLFWPISPLMWGWMTSPIMPGLPLEGTVPDDADEVSAAVPFAQTEDADDHFGVDVSWAGALLAAGLLTVSREDRERTLLPGQIITNRNEDPCASQ